MLQLNHKDLTPKRILQRGRDENLDDFLSKTIMLSKKKRRLYNVSKRKLSADNHKPKMIAIRSLNNLDKIDLLISILTLTLDISVVNVAMIGANAYYATCKLKQAQVFAASMRDLEFQIAKEAKLEIDPKSVIYSTHLAVGKILAVL